MNYMVKIEERESNTIIDWLHENKIDDYSMWVSAWNTGRDRFILEFENDEDATAFKLRWG